MRGISSVRQGRLCAAAALVLSLVLAGLVAWPQPTARREPRRAGASQPSKAIAVETHSGSLASASGDPLPFVGRFGVESHEVERENAQQGTTAWEIPASMSTVVIQGFADHVYAAAGDTVGLYVSTPSTRFRVEAFRMGYYGGAGARLVWASNDIVGRKQAPCQMTNATNMVSCANWTRSLRLRVTSAFVQGDYLLKLVASGGIGESYVPLTVWDPASHAAYLIKNDIFTWQAWNPYGGYDFYAGQGSCPRDVYPVCNRARIVSFDRPYGTGDGAGDFLGNEYPLVRFAEQHDLDVAYATDLTIQQHPSFVWAHRVLLSLGHDECWSLSERQAAIAGVAHGTNLVFFAASPILRHVRLQPSALAPDREEVDYRDGAADPLNGTGNPLDVTGNTWSSPPANWSEDSFVGSAYAGFLEPNAAPADFTVADGSAWVFNGTGLQTGSKIPGLLRSDFDHFETSTHPPNEEILAHSRIPLNQAQSQIGVSQGGVYSDMTYYTNPTSGAGILDTGTNNWIPALTPCPPGTPACPAPTITKITDNLLQVFGAGPAAQEQPATPNWQQFY